jgi:hypothetical protein
MDFIIHLLTRRHHLRVAYILPQIHIRSFGLAIVGGHCDRVAQRNHWFLLRLPLKWVTLGLLSFFVRLFVSAIIIKLVDSCSRDSRSGVLAGVGVWPWSLPWPALSWTTCL